MENNDGRVLKSLDDTSVENVAGGSGLTKPEDELPARFPQATWKPGRLFNGGVAASTLRAWANGVMS
jgi:hypothetical protein